MPIAGSFTIQECLANAKLVQFQIMVLTLLDLTKMEIGLLKTLGVKIGVIKAIFTLKQETHVE